MRPELRLFKCGHLNFLSPNEDTWTGGVGEWLGLLQL
ncbi:MAG: hypothetical protein JWP44_2923 [Mucilaginibacter sp.]|nr:hypothetical protein [Mucilaginibacter sp.]